MSKLLDETIAIIKELRRYAEDSHTEYSLEDCQRRGDIFDRTDVLLDNLNDMKFEIEYAGEGS